jgi:hypothetical protein
VRSSKDRGAPTSRKRSSHLGSDMVTTASGRMLTERGNARGKGLPIVLRSGRGGSVRGSMAVRDLGTERNPQGDKRHADARGDDHDRRQTTGRLGTNSQPNPERCDRE